MSEIVKKKLIKRKKAQNKDDNKKNVRSKDNEKHELPQKEHHKKKIVKKPKKRNKKTWKRKERRFKIPKSFWKGVLLSAVLVAALIGIGLSPLFMIKNIVVEGNQIYKAEEIKVASGIIVGTNWFYNLNNNIADIVLFRNRLAESRIKSYRPYIKQAEVSYGLLNKAKINVTERKPDAYFPYMGTYLVVDNELIVLENTRDTQKIKLPIIRGFNIEKFKLGEKMIIKNPLMYDDYKAASDYIKRNDRGTRSKIYPRITEIEFDDQAKIKIVLDDRIRVILGDYIRINDYKLNFLREIFFKKLKEDERGSLDFSRQDEPGFTPD